MNLIEAIKPFQLDYGIIGLTSPAKAEENPHLFTATYLNLCRILGIKDRDTIEKYKIFLSKCEVKKGLYNRYPNYISRLVSHDEYIGICNFSEENAKAACQYGHKHLWFFNNSNMDDLVTYGESWHWRMGIAVPYYKLRAGEQPSFLDNLLLSVNLFLAANSDKSNTSSRCMIFLMRDKYKNHSSFLVRYMYKRFLKDLENKYSDLSGLYSIYFGPQHPLSIYSKGVKYDS